MPLKDFLNNGASTNTATLSFLGLVEDRLLGTSGLTGGPHSYTASYSGDISYNASAGPGLAITITPALTATTVTANGAATKTVSTGQAVTLVATIPGFYVADGARQASNGAGPTGTVTFSACGTAASCTVTAVPTAFTNANGLAFATGTLSIPNGFSTAEVQNITATFTTADTNYSSCLTAAPPNGCTFTAAVVTVNPAVTGALRWLQRH